MDETRLTFNEIEQKYKRTLEKCGYGVIGKSEYSTYVKAMMEGEEK